MFVMIELYHPRCINIFVTTLKLRNFGGSNFR